VKFTRKKSTYVSYSSFGAGGRSKIHVCMLPFILAAIRLLKFTIEDPLGCMQPAGNSANAERSGSHNLLPRSMFHFVEIKRQNKRKETVKYSGTKQHRVEFSVHRGLDSLAGRSCQDSAGFGHIDQRETLFHYVTTLLHCYCTPPPEST